MDLQLDLQNVIESNLLPSDEIMRACVIATLQEANYTDLSAEITVRVVDLEESQRLNRLYRGKNRPTNVLSFPFESPAHIQCHLLGDLVICLPVVRAEAKAQSKTFDAHWAHLLVHGTLHLLGFDHQEEGEAKKMEALEIAVLERFQINNPYL